MKSQACQPGSRRERDQPIDFRANPISVQPAALTTAMILMGAFIPSMCGCRTTLTIKKKNRKTRVVAAHFSILDVLLIWHLELLEYVSVKDTQLLVAVYFKKLCNLGFDGWWMGRTNSSRLTGAPFLFVYHLQFVTLNHDALQNVWINMYIRGVTIHSQQQFYLYHDLWMIFVRLQQFDLKPFSDSLELEHLDTTMDHFFFTCYSVLAWQWCHRQVRQLISGKSIQGHNRYTPLHRWCKSSPEPEIPGATGTVQLQSERCPPVKPSKGLHLLMADTGCRPISCELVLRWPQCGAWCSEAVWHNKHDD